MNAQLKIDSDLVERTSGALGVDGAFVEKDIHVVNILSALQRISFEQCSLVFGGGTSLSKGFGIIRRFSEDIDFRVVSKERVEALTEGKRRSFRNLVEKAIEDLGYEIDEDRTKRWNGGRMFALFVPYSPAYEHPGLRPDVKIEVTLAAPIFPTLSRSVASFVSIVQRKKPEVAAIQCVDPVETAADKLAALSWRVFEHMKLPDAAEPPAKSRDRSLVRHVHDLCALEESVRKDDRFGKLATDLLKKDAQSRGQGSAAIRPAELDKLLSIMIDILRQSPFPADYELFVRETVYGTPVPAFSHAMDAMERMSKLIA